MGPSLTHMLPIVPDPHRSGQDAAIRYPQSFPIKFMGDKRDGFVHAVTETARQFDPSFDAGTIELRESRSGRYLSVTIIVWATSRPQLDQLYRALTSHPMVKVVL